jgi:hypothetical protein
MNRTELEQRMKDLEKNVAIGHMSAGAAIAAAMLSALELEEEFKRLDQIETAVEQLYMGLLCGFEVPTGGAQEQHYLSGLEFLKLAQRQFALARLAGYPKVGT